MSKVNYAYQKDMEKTAKAAMRNVRVSTKTAIEMCNHLRYKELAKARAEVEEIAKMKKPLPFRRFTNGLGHRKGIGASGRYPVNAAKAFLTLFDSVQANASNLTLGENLKIVHLAAQKGNNDFRWGRRQRRQLRKNTHLEIVVKEIEKKKSKTAKAAKTAEAVKTVEKQKKPVSESNKTEEKK